MWYGYGSKGISSIRLLGFASLAGLLSKALAFLERLDGLFSGACTFLGRYSVRASNGKECVVEGPLHGVFDRLIEDIREEWDDRQAELWQQEGLLSKWISCQTSDADTLTPIGVHVRTRAFFASLSARPEYLTTEWMVKAGNPILATA
jgi:hypothetical protein